jgi:hypothetical protein
VRPQFNVSLGTAEERNSVASTVVRIAWRVCRTAGWRRCHCEDETLWLRSRGRKRAFAAARSGRMKVRMVRAGGIGRDREEASTCSYLQQSHQ